MVIRLLAMLINRRKRSKRWLVTAVCVVIALVACIIWVQLQMTGTSVLAPMSGSGSGAGGMGVIATNPMKPDAPGLCNPFDPNCFADGIAGWLAGKLHDAFQPITSAMTGSEVNIITQTPGPASYGNETILGLNQTFVTVFDGALAALLAVGAVNIMIGHHWSTFRTSVGELIPRAVLVTAAVHFNLLLLIGFIQFENALCTSVINAAGVAMLTNIIAGLFTSTGLTTILMWILVIVLAVMDVYLCIQMIGRLALVALGLAVAPLGLGCFLLPQTERWGRLWLTLFTSAVIVQFLQVLALGLGGTFLTAIVNPKDPLQPLISLFLAIGMLGLVLKIPGMLQHWALHPATGGGSGSRGSGGGDAGSLEGGSSGSLEGGIEGGFEGGSTGGMMEGTIVTEESGAMLLLF